ncbi:TPA: tail fiber assembly protein [Escherichia coli]|uniref:tail fiber assembly protein n=1 Tax=Escherichia coli TaxID=562 RepID=UPI0004D89C95|nr:tail fiber assembly protein [Escherichia coli]DAE80650.1 MAG TPA: tail fiber assembly protein [Caudoviricetes sp.]EFT2769168.1 tail fiber assembly protein [Escherichia coli]EHO8309515.1 tail fiber assembly protein [Escherichia coli]KDT28318.1 caudovirales tail fiber assembly family protein [Escherichia coli 3-105-05_S1_C1]MEB7199311.1 tail fiber assembly protein [Escherichia coli]
MFSNIYFSAKNNSFFFESMKSDYEKTNTWPDDIVEVESDIYQKYTGRPPEGKGRGGDASGQPVWVDVSEPTADQLIALAIQQKKDLAENAGTEIAWRQDAIEAGISTDDEVIQLAKWKKYRVLLMRIDTSKAPDIIWPDIPED